MNVDGVAAVVGGTPHLGGLVILLFAVVPHQLPADVTDERLLVRGSHVAGLHGGLGVGRLFTWWAALRHGDHLCPLRFIRHDEIAREAVDLIDRSQIENLRIYCPHRVSDRCSSASMRRVE